MKEKLIALLELLDWITQAEEALGSEQPEAEQSAPVSDQLETHTVQNINPFVPTPSCKE